MRYSGWATRAARQPGLHGNLHWIAAYVTTMLIVGFVVKQTRLIAVILQPRHCLGDPFCCVHAQSNDVFFQ